MTAARMSLAVLAAAIAGGGASWLILTQRPMPAPIRQPEDPGEGRLPESDPPPVAEAPVPEPGHDPSGEPKGGMLLLPDGSKVAPLNGVVDPPKLVWQNPEWSPIVRTEHNGDIDWYVHADGSYSTTLMIWRSDLGRADAVSYALHPRDPVPTAPLPDGVPTPDKR